MKTDIFISDINEIVKANYELAKKLEDKRILITGGSGFLGKYLVATLNLFNKKLLKKKCRIISIDNYITSSRLKNALLETGKYLKYIRHNVVKPLKIGDQIDFILHLAGIASPVYYQKYPLETIDPAVGGARNMLDLAHKKRVQSFLYFSSSEIYGNPPKDKIPTKENYNGNVSSIGERACYDESKRLGETLCMTYFRLYKTPVKIVRPFNVFGPGMNYKDHRVIPTFIYKALKKSPLPVHSQGRQTRTFCYITDATTAFLKVLLLGKPGNAYNVGSDTDEINMNTLANILNRIYRGKLKIAHIPYPKNYPQDEPLRRCPDLSKIAAHVNYKSSISLEVGIKRMLTWAQENWK